MENLITTIGKKPNHQSIKPGPISSKHGLIAAFTELFEPTVRLVRLDPKEYNKKRGSTTQRRKRTPKAQQQQSPDSQCKLS